MWIRWKNNRIEAFGIKQILSNISIPFAYRCDDSFYYANVIHSRFIILDLTESFFFALFKTEYSSYSITITDFILIWIFW